MNDREILIKQNIEHIYQTIEKVCKDIHRDPASVRIMAVSKTMPVEDIVTAIECGISIIGENMVQEAQNKYVLLKDVLKQKDISFHFIGHLQSNKIKLANEIFDSIDSIDRLKIAEKLSSCAAQNAKKIRCLIQANAAKEDTKFGAYEEEIKDLVYAVSTMENLELLGFFAIPPYFADPEQSRIYFKSLRLLRDMMKKEFPDRNLSELSMGMSHDYHVAIEEGATIIRIGQSIFGERVKH